MDDALDAFTEQILKEKEDKCQFMLDKKREKWDLKLHNGYRMFNFDSRNL
jgi:hypothetical protein